jgi:hypothetical protein
MSSTNAFDCTQSIIHEAPFGFATSVLDTHLNCGNATLCEWLGYASDEMPGRTRDEFLEPSSTVKLRSWLERTSIGQTSGPVRLDARRESGAKVALDVHLHKRYD